MSFTFVASAGDWARMRLCFAGRDGLLVLLADLLLPQNEQARLAWINNPGASIPSRFSCFLC